MPPMRPSGTLRSVTGMSPFADASSVNGVAVGPGPMAFTRMLYGAQSTAITRVICTTAALLAQYATLNGEVTSAICDEMLMMTPPPESRIAAAAAWQNKKTAVQLTPKTSSQSW